MLAEGSTDWYPGGRPGSPEPARRDAQGSGAESQNRTGDTAIFSRVLYRLSYLGPCLIGRSTRRPGRGYHGLSAEWPPGLGPLGGRADSRPTAGPSARDFAEIPPPGALWTTSCPVDPRSSRYRACWCTATHGQLSILGNRAFGLTARQLGAELLRTAPGRERRDPGRADWRDRSGRLTGPQRSCGRNLSEVGRRTRSAGPNAGSASKRLDQLPRRIPSWRPRSSRRRRAAGAPRQSAGGAG